MRQIKKGGQSGFKGRRLPAVKLLLLTYGIIHPVELDYEWGEG